MSRQARKDKRILGTVLVYEVLAAPKEESNGVWFNFYNTAFLAGKKTTLE